jgi:hypothetical protein
VRDRRLTLILVAVATLAFAVPAARAVIVVQRGIAGVELQMTKAQVRAALGRPQRARLGTNEFGSFRQLVYRRVTVTFQSGPRVTDVRTRSRLERTGRDVGVDSTVADVKAHVPGVRCRTEAGFRHCFVGKFLPGRVVTDFRIGNGRVSSVSIGFVID